MNNWEINSTYKGKERVKDFLAHFKFYLKQWCTVVEETNQAKSVILCPIKLWGKDEEGEIPWIRIGVEGDVRLPAVVVAGHVGVHLHIESDPDREGCAVQPVEVEESKHLEMQDF